MSVSEASIFTRSPTLNAQPSFLPIANPDPLATSSFAFGSVEPTTSFSLLGSLKGAPYRASGPFPLFGLFFHVRRWRDFLMFLRTFSTSRHLTALAARTDHIRILCDSEDDFLSKIAMHRKSIPLNSYYSRTSARCALDMSLVRESSRASPSGPL